MLEIITMIYEEIGIKNIIIDRFVTCAEYENVQYFTQLIQTEQKKSTIVCLVY